MNLMKLSIILTEIKTSQPLPLPLPLPQPLPQPS